MRLGKVGTVIALGALGLIALAVIIVIGVAIQKKISANSRESERRHREQLRDAEYRLTAWTHFSRPDLDSGGRTWVVGVERIAESDGRPLSDPVVLRTLAADDVQERMDAEGEAMTKAYEWSASGAR